MATKLDDRHKDEQVSEKENISQDSPLDQKTDEPFNTETSALNKEKLVDVEDSSVSSTLNNEENSQAEKHQSDAKSSQEDPDNESISESGKTKTPFLSSLKKLTEKKEEVLVSSKFDSNSDGYVSAREAINALDEELAVTTLTEEEVAAEVRRKLEQEAEYFVFRIRKSWLMLLSGMVLLLVWVFLLTTSWHKDGYDWRTLWLKNDDAQKISEEPTIAENQATPSPSPRIRIKSIEGDIRVDAILGVLQENGYALVDVEVVDELEEGVRVAVKTNKSELSAQLIQLLSQAYEASLSATVVTDDSDFEGVILIGPEK